jgi:hypothetical protein
MEEIFIKSEKTKEVIKSEREKNKMTPEQRKEYNNQYYKQNNSKWKTQYNSKDKDIYVECKICICEIKKRHIGEHIKTKKHIRNVEKNKQNQEIKNTE